jgi:pimeloyl-ACP methyl ester carboxylesterase
MPPIAVLIPGIMGSELRLGDEVIWPGPIKSLIFAYKKMDQLLSPDLVPTHLIRSYAFSTQYQAILDDLTDLGFNETERTLIDFPYDWRKANEHTADKLADLLDTFPELHGADAEVTLIAHSMGGLIARHYLESGRFKDRPGFGRVRRLVTLGTPHRGAPLALIRILGLEQALWLSAAQMKAATNDSRYPAPYQLLPPPSEVFAWDDHPASELAGLDPYDPEVGRALGLNPDSVEAARAFHATLDPMRRPAGVRYFCFSGTRLTTTAFTKFTRTGAGYRVKKVERDASGDGTVPFWSSTLPGVQCLAVGGEHSAIYKDRELRRILAALLGQPGHLGPLPFESTGPPTVDVTVREKVLGAGQQLHLTLNPDTGVTVLDGEVRVERADDPAGTSPVFTPIGAPLRIRYEGPLAESVGLIVDAPPEVGGYRIAYYHRDSAELTGSDEFFVQEAAP